MSVSSYQLHLVHLILKYLEIFLGHLGGWVLQGFHIFPPYATS